MPTKINIDIQSLNINWQPESNYYVSIDAGFVREAGGEQLDSPEQNPAFSFTTPAIPEIDSTVPINNATDVTNTSLEVVYDRTVIFKNAGNFYLYKVDTPSDVLVATIPVSTVSLDGNKLTLNLLGTLDGGFTYYITADAGVIKDVFDFQSMIVNDDSIFKFTTDEYSIISVNPTLNSVDIFDTTVVITFERVPELGTGNFYVYESGGTLINTLANNDLRVTINNNDVNIDLKGIIDGENTYYITADSGIVKDQYEFNFKGITSDDVIKFTTGSKPFVISTIPLDNSTISNSTVELVFNRNIFKNTGNIYLYKVDSPDVLVNTFDIDSATITDDTISFNVGNFLEPSTSYYIKTDSDIVRDQYEFRYVGIDDDTTFNFLSPAGPAIFSTIPADNSTNVYNGNIEITFDKDVVKDTGNIYLYKSGSPDDLLGTFSITSLPDLVNNRTITTDVFSLLSPNNSFYITSDENIVRETQFNFGFPGILNSSEFNFSVGSNLYKSLTPPVDLQDNSNFGQVVSTDGIFAVITSTWPSNNTSYSYLYDATTGEYIRTFTTSTGVRHSSSSISGSLIAFGDIVNNRVRIHSSSGSLLRTISNPNSNTTSTDDRFGYSVNLNGTKLLVGAPYENVISGVTEYDKAGVAYVFNASTGSLLFTIPNPNPGTSHQFGRSVAISENYIVISKSSTTGSDAAQKVYIFDATDASLLFTLSNPNPVGSSTGDNFGESIALSGNYLIVGAPYEDDANTNAGKAYIYDVTTGTLLFTLDNPNTSSSDLFGLSVSISGNYGIVGAPQEDTNSGKAYIYDVTTGTLLFTLDNPNIVGSSTGDNFASSISISGDYVVIGAPNEDDSNGANAGSAYLFKIS